MVFVGQNPGAQEDQQGEAFVGPTGQLVRGKGTTKGIYLDALQFRTRAAIYLTNTARCATFGEEEPTASNYNTCWPHTVADLRTIAASHDLAAKHIVLLGAKAVSTFFRWTTGKSKSLDKAITHNGTLHTLPDCSQWRVWATWHPAYLIRNKKIIHSVSDHLRLISDGLSGLSATPSLPRLVPPRLPPKERN